MKKFVVRIALVLTALVLISACGKSVPNADNVKESIKNILPGTFEVVNVAKSNELNGLVEVVVKVNGQYVVFYMDKGLKYLVSGSVVELSSKKNLTLETQKKYITAQPAPSNQPSPAKK